MKNPALKKAYFIRKLHVFILLTLSLIISVSISANNRNSSLTTELSITKEQKSVREILHDIEKNSKHLFVYQDADVQLDNAAQQQTQTVSGIIKDKAGLPIIGVTVAVKSNKQIGTITDTNGRYSLSVPSNTTLVYSYVGYQSQEIVVGTKAQIDIILGEDETILSEIVVVGYGVQKRSDLTGAISSVKASELPQSATSSVENMLSGKVSGMQVTAVDAQPGGGLSISIRGNGSDLASNDPLYVIDGFPVSGGLDPATGASRDQGKYKTSQMDRSPLNSINPNDIASIEVLKDASATAIYGARAANGVVLITTKSGQQGKPKVSYDMKLGVQKMVNDWKLYNASEWYGARNKYDHERWLIDNKFAPYGSTSPTGSAKLTYTPEQIANVGKGTDWIDEVTQTGITNEHNVSIGGATDIINYLASANYYDQEGVLKNNNFTRYSTRLNISSAIRKWLKVGLNATGSQIKFRNPTLGTGSSEASGLIEAARVFSPDLPIRDENGDFTYVPNASTFPNPVSLLDISNRTKQDRILAQGFVEITPIQDLMLRMQVGVDKQNARTNMYLPKTTLYGQRVNGQAIINSMEKIDKLVSLTANYSKTIFTDHRFNALIGYEWNPSTTIGNYMETTNFPSDGPGTNSVGDGKSRPTIASSKDVVEFASVFGRLNYVYSDKYLFTFSLRADGSDKFGQNNRWGYFPSAALAWRIDQENFMKQVTPISNAKLRLSVGQTGNSAIPRSSYGYYNFSGKRDYYFGGALQAGAFQENYANPDLKWETTTEYNLGLDLGFLKNRLNLTVELFSRQVKDLLAYRKTLYYLPGSEILANIGKSSSRGFDININGQIFDGEFKWNSAVNLSAYRDKWKYRNPDVALGPHQSQTDYMRVIWGYQADGIIQPGEKLAYGNWLVGGQKVKDIAGVDKDGKRVMQPDGVISDADRVMLGRQDPDLIYGFTNTFEYKSFDLNIHMYGFLGWKKNNPWLSGVKDMHNKLAMGYNYSRLNLNDFWSSENQNAKYPNIFSNEGEPGATQFAIEKADFLRVKNITLGYTFSNMKEVRKWFDYVRLYVDVSNPFLFSKFTKIDPEYSGTFDSDAGGGTYPVSRAVTFGLSFQF